MPFGGVPNEGVASLLHLDNHTVLFCQNSFIPLRFDYCLLVLNFSLVVLHIN